MKYESNLLRRFCAIALAGAMVFGGSFAQIVGSAGGGITVNAADEEPAEEPSYSFYYWENSDGTVTINGISQNTESIVVPSEIGGKTVTAIDSNAFMDCSRLTEITIPESVEYIGYLAFGYAYYDNGFEGIYKFPSVTVYGYSASAAQSYAFENDFEFVEIGDDVPDEPIEPDEPIDSYYDSASGFYYWVNEEGTITISGTDMESESVYIPSSINGMTVTAIAESAFVGDDTMKEIDIPSTVTDIGYHAFGFFYDEENEIECQLPLTIYCYSDSAAETYAIENGFSYFTKFDDPYIPDEPIVESPFSYTENEDGTLTITGYNGEEQEISIPSEIDGMAVTGIGDSAFYCCYSLNSVIIPESVTIIGEKAFAYCDSLTSIIIPDSVTNVEQEAFNACKNLTSVIIGNGVVDIGDSAFYICSSLTSVTIGNSVRSIGNYVFEGCRSLTSVTFPESVESIGYYAFFNCDSLTSVTIGNNVTSIGNYAFGYHEVFDDGFGEIVKLDDFTIYGIVDSEANYYAKENDIDFLIESPFSYTENEDGTLTITGYNGEEQEISIPSEIDGMAVTCIGNGAFFVSKLTSISIPDSVTSIGEWAFAYCGELTSLTIPDSVTYIGEYAFAHCINLTSFRIPYSLNSIEKQTFYSCGIDFISIPDSVTKIGDGSFADCVHLLSITIPDSVQSIEKLAFCNCNRMTSIEIPDSVTSIGEKAFADCRSLNSVTIPDSVTFIENSSFYNCPSLAFVTIPDSVTSIGEKAFGYYYDYERNKLTTVEDFTIYGYNGSAAETYANKNGFEFVSMDDEPVTSGTTGDCTWSYDIETETLTISGEGDTDYYNEDAVQPWSDFTVSNLVIEDGVKALRAGVFAGLDIETVTIPSSVETIGMIAFRDCSKLKKVVLNSGIVELNGGAFNGCSALEEINLPDTIMRFGPFVFEGCKKLDFDTIPDSIIEIGAGAFSDTEWYASLPDGDVYIGKVYYTYKGQMPANYVAAPKDGTVAFAAGAFAMNGEQPNLTDVIIPSSLTVIPELAFFGCENLKSIAIPATVESIDNMAIGFHLDNETESMVAYEGVVIYGEPGSVAENYANEYGFKFNELAALSNASTISAQKIAPGEKVTISGKASGGIGEYTYTYEYQKAGKTTWTQFGTGKTAVFKPGAGVFTVRVTVTDSKGSTDIRTFAVNCSMPLENNSTISAENIIPGEKVTITGKAAGGIAPYIYKYEYQKAGKTTWTDFGSGTTAVFKPGEGTFTIHAIVIDSTGMDSVKTYTVNCAAPFVNESTISAEQINLGEKVTITGKATGGTAPYTYKYEYQKAGKTTWTQFGSGKSAVFKPGTGVFTVRVTAADSNGKEEVKEFIVSCGVTVEPFANESTISAEQINLGEKVTITGKATGGTAPYTFKYEYQKAGKTTWTSFGSGKTAVFKPGTGIFKIRVTAADSMGKEEVKEFTFACGVTIEPLVNESTISAEKINLGEKVMITGKATGGTAPYTYKYEYQKAGKTTWTEFGSGKISYFKPGTGTFTIKVTVTDSIGKTDEKTFTVTCS